MLTEGQDFSHIRNEGQESWRLFGNSLETCVVFEIPFNVCKEAEKGIQKSIKVTDREAEISREDIDDVNEG